MQTINIRQEADVVAPYWQNSLTSALRILLRVEKPAAAIKTVRLSYKLTPTIVGKQYTVSDSFFWWVDSCYSNGDDADTYITNERVKAMWKNVTFTP